MKWMRSSLKGSLMVSAGGDGAALWMKQGWVQVLVHPGSWVKVSNCVLVNKRSQRSFRRMEVASVGEQSWFRALAARPVTTLRWRERDGWWCFLPSDRRQLLGHCWCSRGESPKMTLSEERRGRSWTVELDVVRVAAEAVTAAGVMAGAWPGGWLQRLEITAIKVWIQFHILTPWLCVSGKLEHSWNLGLKCFHSKPVGQGPKMRLMFHQGRSVIVSLRLICMFQLWSFESCELLASSHFVPLVSFKSTTMAAMNQLTCAIALRWQQPPPEWPPVLSQQHCCDVVDASAWAAGRNVLKRQEGILGAVPVRLGPG